jgi:hypothetical protein
MLEIVVCNAEFQKLDQKMIIIIRKIVLFDLKLVLIAHSYWYIKKYNYNFRIIKCIDKQDASWEYQMP